MGGHPWFYIVDYDPDFARALKKLREREFRAGRYNPVTPFPEFPITDASPAPGAQHASIEAALEASMEDGTRSILDMQGILPQRELLYVMPLEPDEVEGIYGTPKPTRQSVEQDLSFLDDVGRGEGVCFVVYEDDQPSGIVFGGYSVD